MLVMSNEETNIMSYISIPLEDSKAPIPSLLALPAEEKTPVTPLRTMRDSYGIDAWVKHESFNPTGSIKYRAAKHIVDQMRERGELPCGSSIVESSSGNMGAALAAICQQYNLGFTCVVDPRVQPYNLELIRSYGADICMVSEPLNGDFLTARIAKVKAILSHDSRFRWTNQYENPLNLNAHYYSTAPEIFSDFSTSLDYLFVATSSTGTFNGIRKFFKENSPNTVIVAVDASGSVLFNGVAGSRKISGMGAGIATSLSKLSTPQILYRISDGDCVKGCYRHRSDENLDVGGSTGALYEALFQNREFYKGKRVLILSADGAEKYQSTIYNDGWLNENFPDFTKQNAVTKNLEEGALLE